MGRRPRWLRWRRNKLKRWLSGGGLGLLILAAPVLGALYLLWDWPPRYPDQVALVGTVATVVAVWLAAVAAVVALLAYLVADESPDLSIAIVGAGSVASGLDFLLGQNLSDGRREILAPPTVVLRLENSSTFSARAPVIAIALTDTYLDGFDSRWEAFRRTADDISLQWAPGTDVSVHGKGRILAPALSFQSPSCWARPEMTMTVEVFADGFHSKPQPVPIRIQIVDHA